MTPTNLHRTSMATHTTWLLALAVVASTAQLASAQSVRVGIECGAYSYAPIKDLCASTHLTDNAPDATWRSGYSVGEVISDSGTFSTSKEPNSTTNDPSYFYVNGVASTSARASYGSLGVSVSSAISGTFNGGAYYGIASTAEVSFVDKIKVSTQSNEGKIAISGFLDVSELSRTASSNYSGYSGGGLNTLQFRVSTSTGASYYAQNQTLNWNGNLITLGRNFFSFEVDVSNGQEIVIGANLYSNTSAATGSSIAPQYGLPITEALSISESGKITSLNSLHLYINAATPGLTISSASGHDYSPSAVPEPSAVMLALAGLVLLACRKFVQEA